MNKLLLLRSNVKLLLLVLLTLVSSCSPKLHLSSGDGELYPITSELPKDDDIVDYIQPYKMNLDSQMNQVIAVSAIEITKSRPEGTLNNLVADAMAYAALKNNIPVDLTITNYGGLRTPLPKGEIRLHKVFELMPFENLMVTVNFKGSDMTKVFQYIAENGGDPIAGARFTIRDKKPEDITIGGNPVDPNRIYSVLTSDYMANGGDNASFFSLSTDRKEYNIKLRDAIISYIKQLNQEGKIINPKIDGRITIE